MKSASKSLITIRIGVLALAVLVAGLAQPWRLLAQGQAPTPAKGVKYAQISPTEMQEWLTYLSSDTLLGRQVFTEGYGLAAGYISGLVKQWGLKPLGGSYLQTVKLKGYKVTRNSSVTVDVNGQSRTFMHGDHVTFATSAGAKQTLTFTGAEFMGYGQPADYQGKDVKGKLVLWVPNLAPQAAGGRGGRGGRGGGRGGGAAAVGTMGAKAAIGFTPAPAPATPAEEALARAQSALTQATDAVNQASQAVLAAQRGQGGGFAGGFGGGGGRGRGAVTVPADITTVERVDGVVAPQFTADDTFFDFLLTGWPTKFADIRAKADKGEAIASFSLPAVKVTVNIDNTYDVVTEQITHNVVAMVEGTDPKLKDTYVFIGAHLDHIGYSQTGGGSQPAPTACRARGPLAIDALTKAGTTPQNAGRRGGGQPAAAPAAGAAGAGAPAAGAGAAAAQAQAAAGAGRGAAGRGAAPATPALPFDQRDFISNGADDDGSGSTATLAVAKAFATGPKPKRSIVFVWHAGEEAGLYGSRYNADFPVVPLDKVQAQLNMDMVGRDDCNDIEGDYSNSVFIVGADRISTDLHNLIVETNQTMTKPLGLDYELNDAADPESVYTRSDHYSYASKGIPIAFFTTGLHPDYHRVSDTVDKILFPKMARIAQLVYETGFSIANTDKVLTRDNKGPRTGFATKPEIIK